MNGEAFERDCLGIWWIENGVNVVLTSPALNARQLLQIAESLRPLDVARPIPFMSRTVRQAGGRRVRAGNVAEHPIPSVTYLSNLDAYLDRTAAGFIALAGEDPDRRRPIAWNVQRQSFQSVTCGRVYSWLGRCVQGPCRDGLERLDVSIDGDEVIVDARARFIDANRPLEFHSILSRGPAWP